MSKSILKKELASRAAFFFLAVFSGLLLVVQGCDSGKSTNSPPSGLMCELMEFPEKAVINDARPEFCWIMNSELDDDYQSAYRIIVATSSGNLEKDTGDMWDTGKVVSGESVNVEYDGGTLQPDTDYYWKVRTWDKSGNPSPYSAAQKYHTGKLDGYITSHYPLEKHEVKPLRVVKKHTGHYFIDFGKAAFGTVKLTLTSQSENHITEVHLGEAALGDNTVNPNPGGTIRYRKLVLPLEQGTHTYVVEIAPDERNTGARAIKMPEETGEVMPFRYCEIINCPSELDQSTISQIAVNYPFNDDAARFSSSSQVLDDVWELCKYSIKATSFCGIYVDGDRERIPYEADAYLNQLCHYCVDREFTMARRSHEYLITHPTWPTEWILHSVLMAWADYLYTGNPESIENHYDDLKAKTLVALEGGDGLISTTAASVPDSVLESIHYDGRLQDIVDWPSASFGESNIPGERDGYVMRDINTVVNAFHFQALTLMGKMAAVMRNREDAEFFSRRADLVKNSINEQLFDTSRGVYADGEGTDHASLHANMLPLAFGIVPAEYEHSVVDFIKTRGMACSVYGAQYLMEALYRAGESDYALSLLTATSERGWAHMLYDVGSTITLEAWDPKYKPNLDYNHAWGAAPANVIPRLLMGVQPLEPGFSMIEIKPQPGGLESGSLTLPTIRGTVLVGFEADDQTAFILNISIPANTRARVYLPRLGNDSPRVTVDGVPRQGVMDGDFVLLDNIGSGEHRFERHI